MRTGVCNRKQRAEKAATTSSKAVTKEAATSTASCCSRYDGRSHGAERRERKNANKTAVLQGLVQHRLVIRTWGNIPSARKHANYRDSTFDSTRALSCWEAQLGWGARSHRRLHTKGSHFEPVGTQPHGSPTF